MGGDLVLEGLHMGSGQPDEAVVAIFSDFGIRASDTVEGLRIQSSGSGRNISSGYSRDFSGQPDLAQTLACLMAGLGMEGRLSGLGSLRIKETDRILALRQELSKLGVELQEGSDFLVFDGSKVQRQTMPLDTHQDHRMAMSLAPLALVLGELEMLNPDVVRKSYPRFWDEMSHFFHLVV
jgi:3-phosphoshikimate 1-carboxyvinyltransferase